MMEYWHEQRKGVKLGLRMGPLLICMISIRLHMPSFSCIYLSLSLSLFACQLSLVLALASFFDENMISVIVYSTCCEDVVRLG